MDPTDLNTLDFTVPEPITMRQSVCLSQQKAIPLFWWQNNSKLIFWSQPIQSTQQISPILCWQEVLTFYIVILESNRPGHKYREALNHVGFVGIYLIIFIFCHFPVSFLAPLPPCFILPSFQDLLDDMVSLTLFLHLFSNRVLSVTRMRTRTVFISSLRVSIPV